MHPDKSGEWIWTKKIWMCKEAYAEGTCFSCSHIYVHIIGYSTYDNLFFPTKQKRQAEHANEYPTPFQTTHSNLYKTWIINLKWLHAWRLQIIPSIHFAKTAINVLCICTTKPELKDIPWSIIHAYATK